MNSNDNESNICMPSIHFVIVYIQIFDTDFTVTDASISFWIKAISGYKDLSVFIGFVLGE